MQPGTDTIRLTINGKAYEISPDVDSFTASELNAVERNTGMVVQEWAQKLQDARVSSLAWTALAWIAVRRSGEYVRWDDFEDRVNVAALLRSLVDSNVTPADVVAAGDVLTTAAEPMTPPTVPVPPNRAARRGKTAKVDKPVL